MTVVMAAMVTVRPARPVRVACGSRWSLLKVGDDALRIGRTSPPRSQRARKSVRDCARMTSGVRSLLRRPGRVAQLLRYSAVSGISTATSLTILGVLVGVFGVDAVLANVLATAVGTVPSFELNRRWVWFDQSQRSVLRQVTPFCTLSFAGLVISSLAVRFVSARTVDLSRGWHTLAVEAANISAYGALWVVQFFLLDRVLFGRHRASDDRGTADAVAQRSGDDPGPPELRQLVRAETQLVGEDVVGVLAEPRHARFRPLGHVGELHREPRDEHRLVDAVSPGVLDQHVASGQVRVRHHLLVVGDRPGYQARRVQGVAGLALGQTTRP
ncbi:MAG TPA: GtrA family protein, partial [Acidimicrobiales bacterium]|nr:GtrA family protein [Acidimicrobiales bacterium]